MRLLGLVLLDRADRAVLVLGLAALLPATPLHRRAAAAIAPAVTGLLLGRP